MDQIMNKGMGMSKRIALGLVFVGLLSGALVAHGQSFPNKPITLVVPTTAGGTTDAIGRNVANKMATALGQAIVIQNRAGAGGAIGSAFVAKQPADGYTLLTITGANAVKFHMEPALAPNPIADLSAIGMVAKSSYVITANAAAPYNSIPELIEYARKNPGKVNYASAGNGSGGHLVMAMLAARSRVNLTHVAYQGAPQLMPDLMSGRVDIYADTAVGALPNLSSGKVKALAVTGAKRLSTLPAVPTVTEALPEFVFEIWYAIAGPKGLDPVVANKLNAAVEAALNDPSVKSWLASQSFDPVHATVEQTEKFVKADFVAMDQVASQAGLKP